MPIDPRRVYALILGGGAGTRLFPLTKDRAKPAVPIAGKYRLIDVPVSNCLNSGIVHIYILTQYNSESLHRHIHRAYHLGHFTTGFVDVLAAEQTLGGSEWYQGTADAVRRNLWHLTEPSIEHVLILSGDQIYRMDFRQVLATHAAHAADLTVAVTPKRPEEAGGLGVMRVDADLRVVEFVEKPGPERMRDLVLPGESLAPLGVHVTGPVVLASMGIYAFDRATLTEALDTRMDDFGRHIIPWCVENKRTFAHPFAGYWEDVGTIGSYFRANLDLTSWASPFDFYDEDQPVFTHARFLPNPKLDGVELIGSTVSDGCIISGAKITRSVIGLRSVIRPGSVLEEVVMLGQDDYMDSLSPEHHPALPRSRAAGAAPLPARGLGVDCRVTRAIIDKNARIGAGTVITDHTGRPDEECDLYCVREGIVVVPKNAVIPAGTRI
jgi:glucose-1-phosphate adenylyltransferase